MGIGGRITGAIRGAGRSLGNVLLGEEGELTEEEQAASAQRQELVDLLVGRAQEAATREGPGRAEEAALRAGTAAAEGARSRALSSAAGVRGLGALGARRAATREAARAEGAIAAQTTQAAAQAAAQDEAAQLQSLQAALLGTERLQQAALLEEELKRQRGRGGILPAITAGAGAAIGGTYGGPAGAQIGGQLGGALGGQFTRA